MKPPLCIRSHLTLRCNCRGALRPGKRAVGAAFTQSLSTYVHALPALSRSRTPHQLTSNLSTPPPQTVHPPLQAMRVNVALDLERQERKRQNKLELQQQQVLRQKLEALEAEELAKKA